jgi:hypothetical protein
MEQWGHIMVKNMKKTLFLIIFLLISASVYSDEGGFSLGILYFEGNATVSGMNFSNLALYRGCTEYLTLESGSPRVVALSGGVCWI